MHEADPTLSTGAGFQKDPTGRRKLAQLRGHPEHENSVAPAGFGDVDEAPEFRRRIALDHQQHGRGGHFALLLLRFGALGDQRLDAGEHRTGTTGRLGQMGLQR